MQRSTWKSMNGNRQLLLFNSVSSFSEPTSKWLCFLQLKKKIFLIWLTLKKQGAACMKVPLHIYILFTENTVLANNYKSTFNIFVSHLFQWHPKMSVSLTLFLPLHAKNCYLVAEILHAHTHLSIFSTQLWIQGVVYYIIWHCFYLKLTVHIGVLNWLFERHFLCFLSPCNKTLL